MTNLHVEKVIHMEQVSPVLHPPHRKNSSSHVEDPSVYHRTNYTLKDTNICSTAFQVFFPSPPIHFPLLHVTDPWPLPRITIIGP